MTNPQHNKVFEAKLNVSSLNDILSLEKLDNNLFRSLYHCENFRKTLFGGQVLAQALMAAFNTVDGIMPHSLHAYFLRPGSSHSPVIYDVESVRDGRNFTARRAVARQFGRPIFNMSASFHQTEKGYEHQAPYPEHVPTPEDLLAAGLALEDNEQDGDSSSGISPFQLLPIPRSALKHEQHEPVEYFWIKTTETLPKDPIFHLCTLAMASDIGLLGTSLVPHGVSIFDPSIIAASVDHAMWFHTANIDADDWLLYKSYSPWSGGARGFSFGSIYNRNKELIASTAQEGLIRPITPEESDTP
ncbi:Acyl-CoA thioesterase 2 [Thalassocella blandensis]|nr:Acyl-CoA thioesterase 2 [Thalassocella blandensis]